MQQTFSIKEAFKTGWEIFKPKWGFFVVLAIIITAIQIASSVLQMIPILGPIASTAVSIFIATGTIHVFLQMYDNKETSYGALFSQGGRFWVYLGASFLIGLITLGGMVFLIVPGIIASIALSFVLYLVVDRQMGVMESIRTGWAITYGYRLKMFLFSLVAMLLNIVGLLALIVGLLVTVPVTFLAAIHVYRYILAQAEASGKLPVAKLQTWPKVFLWIGFIVPVLVAVASVFFIVAIGGSSDAASDAARMADVMQLQMGAEMYFEANDAYPASVDEMQEYMFRDIPTDPDEYKAYQYTQVSQGASYEICVDFDVKDDECFTPGY